MKRLAPALLLLLACGPARPPRESPPPAASVLPPPAPMQLDPTPGEPFVSSPSCTADVACGWARCNQKAGRCAFPCASDSECSEGARCLPSPGNQDILVCAIPLDAP